MEVLIEWASLAIDVVLNLNTYLASWTSRYGVWIYVILFAIVFAETGLVVTPFLPGDSLLFVAGSIAALGGMDVHFLVAVLFVAAVLGNTVNYEVGRWFGKRYFVDRGSRWLNPEHLARTHAFFERWGPAAVVIARFVPFLRTYVPFVAGLGAMTRAKYMGYTIFGAAMWVGSLVYLGYLFGNIPWIKEHQGLLVVGIIIVSLLPLIAGFVKARLAPVDPAAPPKTAA
ncbi:MAG: VTT domain-containing protein [Betaproteobacteria bacterium]|nr:VTT domain-containing protein [Betaproteobacteria bacterium]